MTHGDLVMIRNRKLREVEGDKIRPMQGNISDLTDLLKEKVEGGYRKILFAISVFPRVDHYNVVVC